MIYNPVPFSVATVDIIKDFAEIVTSITRNLISQILWIETT